MDSQGTGDELLSTPTIDIGILFLGLQLADVQLLNVRSPLQTREFEQLRVGCLNFFWYAKFVKLMYFDPEILKQKITGDPSHGR